MPAYWTESGSDRVQRIVHQTDGVDTSDADYVSDTHLQRPDVEPWVSTELHYNDTDGLYYTKQDPFSGLGLTNSEKHELYDAVTRQDLVKARNIVENALNS